MFPTLDDAQGWCGVKTALILVAALVQQPAQNDTGVASLEPGQSIKCGAAEGCIVLTKRAMHQLLSELAAEANKSCKKAGGV